MTLLAPIALALGLAVPILIIFYLLKIQPTNREIGSTYLWERLLPDLAAHQPWQRPRFPPLFFLQAIFLLALVLAASRPAVFALAEEGLTSVVVLDATASMKATDEQPSRFARARELARTTLKALPEGSSATLVLAGARPRVLAAETADRVTLLSALDQARPEDTASDLGDAIRLAAAIAANGSQGRASRIEVFTDGAFDLPADVREASLPIVWHLVGQPATLNRAITGLAARADRQNQRRQQIFLRVQRFGGSPTQQPPAGGDTTLVTLRADGQIVESRTLTFGPDGVAEAVFENLPDGARVVEARLGESDAVAADDQATLVLERPRATRVLLVSRGNVFLEKALALLPNVELDQVIPRRFGAIVPEDYDVVVFDTDMPDLVPNRPLLLVNPVGSPFLPSDGQLARPAITAWDHSHPVLQNVDLADVRVARALSVQAPGWAVPIVESGGGPLVLAGEDQPGRRVVALAFDLQQTNLPLTTAFPILIANAIGYLEPPGVLSASAIAPGGELTISPALDATAVVVQDPAGAQTVLPVSGRTLAFAGTTAVGLYQVEQRAGDKAIATTAFAVNLLNPAESDPRARQLPAGQTAAPGAARPVAREGWWWLLGVGLTVLVGEWWWYHRR